MGKKNEKEKGGRPRKYQAKFCELVPKLVLKCGMVNTRGRIAWDRVATFLRIDARTIRRWLNPSEPVYHSDFAEAVEKLIEEVDTGRTKRDQVTVSGRHRLHSRNFEMAQIGPMPPKWGWPKRVLLLYASEVLGVALAPSLLKPDLEYEIAYELNAQTQKKRCETTSGWRDVDPNQDAVKLILKNLGDPKHRWNIKDEVEGGAITAINIAYHEIEEDPNAGKSIEDAETDIS